MSVDVWSFWIKAVWAERRPNMKTRSWLSRPEIWLTRLLLNRDHLCTCCWVRFESLTPTFCEYLITFSTCFAIPSSSEPPRSGSSFSFIDCPAHVDPLPDAKGHTFALTYRWRTNIELITYLLFRWWMGSPVSVAFRHIRMVSGEGVLSS